MSVNHRIKRDVASLASAPPEGMVVEVHSLTNLSVDLPGPEGTPYEGGFFTLVLNIPPRYPYVPPEARFSTKIYHPNIDGGGRICCSLLSLPPKGTWTPALHLSAVCASLQSLLSSPNPDDPLDAEAAQRFLTDPTGFAATARSWTARYAAPANTNVAEATTVAPVASQPPPSVVATVDEGGSGGGNVDSDQEEAVVHVPRVGVRERAAAAAAAQATFDDSSSD